MVESQTAALWRKQVESTVESQVAAWSKQVDSKLRVKWQLGYGSSQLFDSCVELRGGSEGEWTALQKRVDSGSEGEWTALQ